MIVRKADRRELLLLARFEQGLPLRELDRLLGSDRVLVAQRGDDLLGVLRWGLLWDSVPALHWLSIAPGQRGKGYGMQLLLQWEQAMCKQRQGRVLAFAPPEQGAAFLRKLGYHDCGWLHLPGREPALLYQKELKYQ